MRKFIVALSVLLLVAVVILKVSYAQDPQEVKKAATETKKDVNCAAVKECPGMTASKTADAKACDHAKTTEMSADNKTKTEGKDATTEAKVGCCEGAIATAKAEAKPCCSK
jgi:hypothetical protein